MNISDWKPARVEEVQEIVREDLVRCDAEQRLAFGRYGVEPYVAPLVRYGNLEHVVVVARRGKEVIYCEDMEHGFNVSAIGDDGSILEHWCNQDDLGLALNAWIEGRKLWARFGPAEPIDLG